MIDQAEITEEVVIDETEKKTNRLTLAILDERIIKLEDLQGSVDKSIERLEFALAKIAHYSGQHKIMVDCGIEPWLPSKDDMRKFKD